MAQRVRCFLLLIVAALTACGARSTTSSRSSAAVPRVVASETPRFTALTNRCGLAEDGRLFCFGRFFPATWTPEQRNYARPVFGITDAVLFDVSYGALCIIRKADARRITCWTGLETEGGHAQPPVDHVLPEPTREISSANQCAVGASSAVYCWGSDADGQYLTGAPYDQARTVVTETPVRLPLPPVRRFVRSLDPHGRCVVTEDGRVGCWGKDNVLEIRAAKLPRTQAVTWLTAPDRIVDAFMVGQLATPAFRTNLICTKSEQGVYACGDKRLEAWLAAHKFARVHSVISALLGLTEDGRLLAYRVIPKSPDLYEAINAELTIDNVTAFGADHIDVLCVLDRQGAIACSGYRDEGSLGSGERLTSATPVRVNVAPAIELTSSGGSTRCVRHADGSVHCWGGFDGSPGILAQRAMTQIRLPEPSRSIVGGEPLCTKGMQRWWCHSRAILPERADGFSALRDPAGKLVPVDAELAIQIGAGIAVTLPSRRRVFFGLDVHAKPLRTRAHSEVGIAGTFNCFTNPDGRRGCACKSFCGYLEPLWTPDNLEPKKVLGSLEDAWLLTMGGDLYAGTRAGCGTDVSWEQVPRLRGVRDAEALDRLLESEAGSICVLLDTGAVLCKGMNRYGELGDGTYQPRDAFRPVAGIPQARALVGGRSSACVLTEGQDVYCWGSDMEGVLGQGSPAMTEMPMPLAFGLARPGPPSAAP